ncbi:MAG TPA: hypothetical protein VGM78_02175 [Ilumatobacteraceae bacterium]
MLRRVGNEALMVWIVAVCIVVVGVAVAYFFLGRSSEQAADHVIGDRHGDARFIGDNQAPAGPGAEDEYVAERGEASPGSAQRD